MVCGAFGGGEGQLLTRWAMKHISVSVCCCRTCHNATSAVNRSSSPLSNHPKPKSNPPHPLHHHPGAHPTTNPIQAPTPNHPSTNLQATSSPLLGQLVQGRCSNQTSMLGTSPNLTQPHPNTNVIPTTKPNHLLPHPPSDPVHWWGWATSSPLLGHV